MDLLIYGKAYALLKQVLDSTEATQPVLDTPLSCKPAFPFPQDRLPPIRMPFPRIAPEEAGISAAYVRAFLDALLTDPSLHIHHVLLMHRGRVFTEVCLAPYDPRMWHVTYSACKTLTGIAIGMLVDDGLLRTDDRVVRILDPGPLHPALLTHKNMTVEHLLTMTSGVLFGEAGASTSTDWLKEFHASAIVHEPGSTFFYNSMNSYVLAAIVRKITGRTLTDFLTERLFRPLGITHFYWEKDPGGLEKGGWGLYIRLEDLAKIGQMLLDGGVFGDRRILSQAWVAQATSAKVSAPQWLGDYDYGYQLWCDRDADGFLMNGMFGQNVFAFRRSGIVVAVNAGNNELFQQSNLFATVRRFFGTDFLPADRPLAPSRTETRRLAAACRMYTALPPSTFRRREAWKQYLDGAVYTFTSPNARGCGLMPLLLQTVQNNFSKGLQQLSFSVRNGVWYVTVTETDETYRMAVGWDAEGFRFTDLSFHGEPYRVGARAVLASDEDGHTVLKLTVAFTECASVRCIKLIFPADPPGLTRPAGAAWPAGAVGLAGAAWPNAGENVTVRLTETPGRDFLLQGLETAETEIRSKALGNLLAEHIDAGYIRYKIDTALEPELTARRV